MDDIVSITIIGFLATAGMISFMWLVTGLTNVQLDMVAAIGSIYTKNTTNALVPGLMMHFTAGVLMTFVYTIFFELAPYQTAYSYALIGLVAGCVHGTVVTVVLKKLLAEHHPMESYRKLNTSGGLAHVVAHVLYGLIIGTLYGSYLI